MKPAATAAGFCLIRSFAAGQRRLFYGVRRLMSFQPIDIEQWKRKEYYEHYLREVVCTYSLTVHLDITALEGQRLYPAMLWLLTASVNEMEEFRTSLTAEGVGVYSDMHPSYTIFNRENKNFSVIWTEFHSDYHAFLKAYERDVNRYGASTRFMPKENKPDNTFDVSMLPWTAFTSCNLNVYGDGRHLLPIFTMGKASVENGKKRLPLAVQVHHAVCDGYHVGKFLENLQTRIAHFPAQI